MIFRRNRLGTIRESSQAGKLSLYEMPSKVMYLNLYANAMSEVTMEDPFMIISVHSGRSEWDAAGQIF